jgi:hypothetical protein
MLLLGRDGVDFVVVGEDEKFAFGVFAEGGGAEFLLLFGAGENLCVGGFSLLMVEGPEGAEAPVAIEVFSLKGGDGGAPVVEAAGDGCAILTAVFVDRVDEGYFLGRFVSPCVGRVGAFVEGPAIIAAIFDDVDFLVSSLTDVGSPEFLAVWMEGEAPRVAEAEGEDFRVVAGCVEEGVVGGESIGAVAGAGVDVNAENLAVVDEGVLGEALGVVALSSVADGDVKVAVGAEENVAGIVVPEGLGEFEEDALGREVGFVGIINGCLHFADAGVLGILERVVEVEFAVLGVVGVERESQKAFFKLLLDEGAVGDIEESDFFRRGTVLWQDGDFSELLDEEEAVGAIGWNGERDGEFNVLVLEGGGDFDEGGSQEGGGGEEEGQDWFHW